MQTHKQLGDGMLGSDLMLCVPWALVDQGLCLFLDARNTHPLADIKAFSVAGRNALSQFEISRIAMPQRTLPYGL